MHGQGSAFALSRAALRLHNNREPVVLVQVALHLPRQARGRNMEPPLSIAGTKTLSDQRSKTPLRLITREVDSKSAVPPGSEVGQRRGRQ